MCQDIMAEFICGSPAELLAELTHRRGHLALVLHPDGVDLEIGEPKGEPDRVEAQLLHAPHIDVEVLCHAVCALPQPLWSSKTAGQIDV